MSRSSRLPAAAMAVLVVGATACASPLDTVLGLVGGRRTAPVPTAAPDAATDAGRRASPPRAPATATSGYEYGPTLEWSRYALGRPFVAGFSLRDRMRHTSCVAVPQGLSRVLPAPEGTPAHDALRLGPVGVGVAGVPVGAVDEALGWRSGSLTGHMLERGTLMASRESCATSVFAYARLGLVGSDDPVAVHR